MISLKQLTYALAVERTLHFKKAAEECAISQSALSTALAEMEKQLGFQVFERDNKKVLVTALGREVLEKAKSIKLQMDDLQRLADANKNPLSTPMSIGIIPTIGPFLLPIILPALREIILSWSSMCPRSNPMCWWIRCVVEILMLPYWRCHLKSTACCHLNFGRRIFTG